MNKRVLLGFSIGVLSIGVLAGVGSAINEKNGWYDSLVNDNTKILNASNLELGDIAENIEVDGITITATSVKNLSVVEKSASYIEYNENGDKVFYRDFTNCIKTNGDSSVESDDDFISFDEFRCFLFDIDTYASVDIFISSNDERTENIELYSIGYNEFNQFEYENIYDYNTDDYLGGRVYSSTLIFRWSLFLEPGSYCFSLHGNVNIFGIEIYE